MTKIEWTDVTWNPVTGCTKVSEACDHCYAERMAKRLAGRYGYPKDEPFRVTIHRDKLTVPVNIPGSKRIFVCSMADLFHKDVPDSFQAWLFDTVIATQQRHTFQMLTKRPERMREFMQGRFYPNVHLGVTAENQQRANERISLLLQTPAAVRFVSCEPLLGPINFVAVRGKPGHQAVGIGAMALRLGVSWVIIGAETGPGARPCKPEWVQSLIDQCRAAGVPVFVKGKLAQLFPFHEFPKVAP